VSGHADSPCARNAARHLAELLRTAYRSRWDRPEYVERAREGSGPHQGAVAHVLAEHLHYHPRERHPDDREVEPSQLEPLVSRALNGTRLSRQTLEIFVSAFTMTEQHAEALREEWNGHRPAQVIIGQLPPPDEMPDYQPPQSDTVLLHEHHRLGPEGLPVRHRTLVTIRSRIDGLASYQYRFDTPHAQVRTLRGGRQGDLYHAGGPIWAVDLTFPHPLSQGETHFMEFWTLLAYDEPPPCEMRRGTHERIENLELRVEFDQRRLPGSVAWAEWGHYTGPGNHVVREEPCSADQERAVHRYVRVVQRAVVGFYWEW
jgi:hypothetical protein